MSVETTAEESQNYILSQLIGSTNEFRLASIKSIDDSITVISATTFIVMMLVIIVFAIFLIYSNVISIRKALVVITIFALLLLIMLLIFSYYVHDLADKSISRALNVFNSFVASEDALILIDDAAAVYLANT